MQVSTLPLDQSFHSLVLINVNLLHKIYFFKDKILSIKVEKIYQTFKTSLGKNVLQYKTKLFFPNQVECKFYQVLGFVQTFVCNLCIFLRLIQLKHEQNQ